MNVFTPLSGLTAATYTPLGQDGCLDRDGIGPMVESLIDRGVNGLYVCGSTGEGMSLSTDERIEVTRAFVKAVSGRVPVIVQVGHNSLADARRLARQAQIDGADAISATCPSYFNVADTASLIACMAEVAGGAADLPFYYYHIPALTGSAIDMPGFMQRAGDAIPNLVGLKYTDTRLFEFQECVELEGGRFDVVWGCDEMLLGALATGAQAAIGSTYNVAAPLYHRLLAAFAEGNFIEARRLQALSIQMIRVLGRRDFHPSMKATLGMLGIEVGPCRLPQGKLTTEETSQLRSELASIRFFDWSQS